MSSKSKALFANEREEFHRKLFKREILIRSSGKDAWQSRTGYIASNGDSGQVFSATLSDDLASKIGANLGESVPDLPKKPSGQVLGKKFDQLCADFLGNCFPEMKHLRPGEYKVDKVGGQDSVQVARYAQYSHLSELKRLADKSDVLATFLGNDYIVSPDVVIARYPEPDEKINGGNMPLVDDNVTREATLRASNYPEGEIKEVLHASISCKFTMRSDRAQNARTEALNLLRNRKGRTPLSFAHVVIKQLKSYMVNRQPFFLATTASLKVSDFWLLALAGRFSISMA